MVDDIGQEAPSSGGGNTHRRLWEILGVAAGVAGVVVGLVQVWPDPPFKLQDWVKEANAVCGETAGEMEEAARASQDYSAQLVIAYRQGMATWQQFYETGNSYYRLAGLQNKRAGDLAKIRTPSEKGEEIEAMLDDMQEGDRLIYQSAEKLRNANSQNLQQATSEYDELTRLYREKAKSINTRMKNMGADDCLPAVPVHEP